MFKMKNFGSFEISSSKIFRNRVVQIKFIKSGKWVTLVNLVFFGLFRVILGQSLEDLSNFGSGRVKAMKIFQFLGRVGLLIEQEIAGQSRSGLMLLYSPPYFDTRLSGQANLGAAPKSLPSKFLNINVN